MANGGVLYSTPDEIRQRADEAIERGRSEHNEAFEVALSDLKERVERVNETARFRDLKLLERVYQFQQDVSKVLGGDAIKVSVNTEDGLIGDLASVTISSKRMYLTNMVFMEKYKDIIFSIDISDYADGHFEFIVAFKGTTLDLKGGDR